MSLHTLIQFTQNQKDPSSGIFSPVTDSHDQYKAIQNLRLSGDRVILGFPDQEPDYDELGCDRQLILVDGKFQILPV
jgi:ATP phosphoribosyltransferase regulatory subunit